MNVTTHRMEHRTNPRPKRITARTREILYWIARGKSNEEIAIITGGSPLTIKNHIYKIFEIYNAPNRMCAVMRAMARGDVSLEELMREFA